MRADARGRSSFRVGVVLLVALAGGCATGHREIGSTEGSPEDVGAVITALRERRSRAERDAASVAFDVSRPIEDRIDASLRLIASSVSLSDDVAKDTAKLADSQEPIAGTTAAAIRFVRHGRNGFRLAERLRGLLTSRHPDSTYELAQYGFEVLRLLAPHAEPLVPFLATGLDSADARVAETTVDALTRLGANARFAVPHMLTAADRGVLRPARTAYAAWCMGGDPSSCVALLLRTIRNRHQPKRERWSACEVLGLLGTHSRRAAADLVDEVRLDSEIAPGAFDGLMAIGEPAATCAHVAASVLRDPAWDHYKGKMYDGRPPRPTMEYEEPIRVRAARALGDIAFVDSVVVDALIVGVDDAEPLVRSASLEAIASLADHEPRLRAALEKAAQSTDMGTRELARRLMRPSAGQ